jgi:hypothetical protein
MGYSLEEKKEIVQRIIDKHLPKGVNFSVDQLNEEMLDLLIMFLIEKDEDTKKSLRKEILEKSKESSKELNIQLLKIQELSEKIEVIPTFREELEESD